MHEKLSLIKDVQNKFNKYYHDTNWLIINID